MTPSIQDRTRQLLERTNALKSGHFLLSSGLHSDRYCQCAALFEHPAVAAEAAALIEPLLAGAAIQADTILTPAIGGILWGYELARQLGLRSLFAERKEGDAFSLRRGFLLHPGERILLAEDVVTTGKSVLELRPLVEAAGARIVGFAPIADRSNGRFSPPEPFLSLIRLDFQTYQPGECPLCARGIPVEKPGSRAQPTLA